MREPSKRKRSTRSLFLEHQTWSSLPIIESRIQTRTGQTRYKRFNSVIQSTLLTDIDYIPLLKNSSGQNTQKTKDRNNFRRRMIEVEKCKFKTISLEELLPLLKLLELFACTLMLPATFIMIF